jgi:hypothetical protein
MLQPKVYLLYRSVRSIFFQTTKKKTGRNSFLAAKLSPLKFIRQDLKQTKHDFFLPKLQRARSALRCELS